MYMYRATFMTHKWYIVKVRRLDEDEEELENVMDLVDEGDAVVLHSDLAALKELLTSGDPDVEVELVE